MSDPSEAKNLSAPSDTVDPVDQGSPSLSATGPESSSPRKPKRGRKPGSRDGKRPVNREGARVDRSGIRHQARIFAMQSLFELDMTEHELPDILTRLTDEEGDALPQPVADRTIRLVRGVQERLVEIDPYITDAAPAFPIPQLASIDRSVLRLAVYELLFERDVPYRAVINEAVEIAKRFGGPSSGRFVNGVLGTIVDRIPESPSAT